MKNPLCVVGELPGGLVLVATHFLQEASKLISGTHKVVTTTHLLNLAKIHGEEDVLPVVSHDVRWDRRLKDFSLKEK